MRTLRFLITGTTIRQDPSCNFDGLFPAPDQEVAAEFVFSSEWVNIPKVAAFYSMLDKEYPPQIIDDECRCMIPSEALNRPTFKLQLLGANRGKTMSTNKLTVYQKGGKA